MRLTEARFAPACTKSPEHRQQRKRCQRARPRKTWGILVAECRRAGTQRARRLRRHSAQPNWCRTSHEILACRAVLQRCRGVRPRQTLAEHHLPKRSNASVASRRAQRIATTSAPCTQRPWRRPAKRRVDHTHSMRPAETASARRRAWRRERPCIKLLPPKKERRPPSCTHFRPWHGGTIRDEGGGDER